MPYSKLVVDLADRTGLEPWVCSDVMRALVATVQEHFKQGEPMNLPGIGTFKTQYFAPRKVVCNFPQRGLKGRTFQKGLRRRLALDPAPNFRHEEPLYKPWRGIAGD